MPTGGGGGGAPKGWPVTFFTLFPNTNTSASPIANQVSVYGFTLGYLLTFSNIAFVVAVADATHNTDIGIYNQAGNLVANIGATLISGTGTQHFATLQGAQTINPGLYTFGFTSAGTALTFNTTANQICWLWNNNVATSSGGVLPASVGALSVSLNTQTPVFALY